MGNNALAVNGNTNRGGTAQVAITTHGSDWYYAATAVMGTATFCFVALSATKPRSDRIFHYITAAITMVATIAYFCMGSNLGWTPIQVEWFRANPLVHGQNREIFYVRYIDWAITTPLLLLDLLLTAGLPWPTILYTILMDEIMVVTGLVGALIWTRYKWGLYSFGCAAFLFIIWNVGFVAPKYAKALGSDIHRTFLLCGVWTLSIWFLYPIAWGLCEGGNVISPDSEAAFYGVLDVLAKPGFGSLLLWGHRNIDPARLGLHIRDYEEAPPTASHNGEKHHGNGGQTGPVNGSSYPNVEGPTYPNTAAPVSNV